jgi:hypothetical protein
MTIAVLCIGAACGIVAGLLAWLVTEPKAKAR